jgi:hypothetical protein
MLSQALESLAEATSRRELDVLDLGAGACEGFDLISSAQTEIGVRSGFRYRAVDKSETMLRLSRKRLGSRAGVTLSERDIRDLEPAEFDVDLVLTVGAPLSHLTISELTELMRRIGVSLIRKTRPTVIILDVLGRFSLEWLPLHAIQRRSYEMSFFSGDEYPTSEMTFYGADEIYALLQETLPSRSVVQWDAAFWDRSVFVGRHTATGRYSDAIPRLRDSINRLATGISESFNRDELFVDLRANLDPFKVPAGVAESLTEAIGQWNSVVSRLPLGDREASLRQLHEVEYRAGTAGRGIGHSLTAVILAPGSP